MPVFRTRFTEMLGIEHPIMMGGMHHVGFAGLAAAVSEAGGMGFVTALTQPSPELLRAEIRKTRQLTKKPIGVNVSFLPAAKPPDYESYIDVIVDENIPAVETAGNNPGKWIQMMKEKTQKRWGKPCVVIHKCVTVRHANTAARMGADVISMDGLECAGHPGMDDVGGLLLFAIAAKKLEIPFIASGGIGDGKQLAAVLAQGAEGINMGTRFMATQECNIHQNIKDTLVKSNHTDTMTILRSIKNTERVFKNEQSLKAAEEERKKPGDIAVVIKYISGSLYKKSFHETGNNQDSVWSCGQVMSLIDDIPTCKALIDRIITEAHTTIGSRLNGFLATPVPKL